ncbi:hypothetical protein RINTHH_12800 [Richelia intracellularis HH01]|uniref:Uncharacterized protein n=1 Tax=Richelia intracellularis HH01 TaxID=1165094 RepID=M1X2U5_9NOST|nr:hypothetical protein RINTHH_12800 [Richelia intracellularis HH01]
MCSIPNIAEYLSTIMNIKAHKISHRLLSNCDDTWERLQEGNRFWHYC